jgi:hypothetical protein
MMNWYIAKLIFRIISGEGQHQPQFDEQLRLLSAGSWQEAIEKAEALGRQGEDTFLNSRQQRVQWEFVNVAELSALGSLKDGLELHYRIAEPGNAEQYIASVHHKAAQIAGRTFAHFS